MISFTVVIHFQHEGCLLWHTIVESWGIPQFLWVQSHEGSFVIHVWKTMLREGDLFITRDKYYWVNSLLSWLISRHGWKQGYISALKYHYSDATWVTWHLKPLATSLFIHHLGKLIAKKISKLLLLALFGWIPLGQQQVDSSSERSEIQKTFPYNKSSCT